MGVESVKPRSRERDREAEFQGWKSRTDECRVAQGLWGQTHDMLHVSAHRKEKPLQKGYRREQKVNRRGTEGEQEGNR